MNVLALLLAAAVGILAWEGLLAVTGRGRGLSSLNVGGGQSAAVDHGGVAILAGRDVYYAPLATRDGGRKVQ